MLLLRRWSAGAPAGPADQRELSHRLEPLPGAMAGAWPVHARRCLHRLRQRLCWAEPVRDPHHSRSPAHSARRANSCCGCTTCPASSTPSSAATAAGPPDHSRATRDPGRTLKP